MRMIVLVSVLAACGSKHPSDTASTTTQKPKVSNATVDHDAPQGEIVTDKVNEMNSSKYGKPPTEFRKGNATATEGPKATKTKAGFQVVFGSGATITTPTVYERLVIVSGGFRSQQLFSYDAKTGASNWALELHDDGPSSPACQRGVCVINTESCTIFAIDVKTGKQLWAYWLGDPLTSAPTIANDLVFASYPASSTADDKPVPPGANHVLAAFELRSGKIVWQMWLDGDVMSAPVAMEDFVYVTTFAGTVIKAEQKTGKVRYAMKAKATSAPVVQFEGGVEQMYYTRRGEAEADGAEEMIIRADHNEPQTKYKAAKKKADYIDAKVQSQTDHAKASKDNDAANGFSGGAPASATASLSLDGVGIQSVSSMQGFQGSRVLKIAGRNVNTMGDEVIATSVETGEKLWSYKLGGDTKKQGGFLGTAPAATKDGVLFGTLEGKVVRLDEKTGTATQIYEVGAAVRSQPVTDDGWIYIGTEDGKLVAIDTKDPKVTGWPTWGGNAQRTGIAQR